MSVDTKAIREKWPDATTTALCNEIDSLRAKVDGYRSNAETDRALFYRMEQQLAAMTVALNEACDIATKKRTWRFQTGPSNWERVDIGLNPDDEIRITKLRKVGQ